MTFEPDKSFFFSTRIRRTWVYRLNHIHLDVPSWNGEWAHLIYTPYHGYCMSSLAEHWNCTKRCGLRGAANGWWDQPKLSILSQPSQLNIPSILTISLSHGVHFISEWQIHFFSNLWFAWWLIKAALDKQTLSQIWQLNIPLIPTMSCSHAVHIIFEWQIHFLS